MSLSAQERTNQLLHGAIPKSLNELSDNSRKLYDIAVYWEKRFADLPSQETFQQTQSYAVHSLQSITDHIVALAGQFNEFLVAQNEQVEEFALEMQSVQTRILSHRNLAGGRIFKSFHEDSNFISSIADSSTEHAPLVNEPPQFMVYSQGCLNFEAFDDVGVMLSDSTPTRMRSDSRAGISMKLPISTTAPVINASSSGSSLVPVSPTHSTSMDVYATPDIERRASVSSPVKQQQPPIQSQVSVQGYDSSQHASQSAPAAQAQQTAGYYSQQQYQQQQYQQQPPPPPMLAQNQQHQQQQYQQQPPPPPMLAQNQQHQQQQYQQQQYQQQQYQQQQYQQQQYQQQQYQQQPPPPPMLAQNQQYQQQQYQQQQYQQQQHQQQQYQQQQYQQQYQQQPPPPPMLAQNQQYQQHYNQQQYQQPPPPPPISTQNQQYQQQPPPPPMLGQNPSYY